jgi:hypothetical protein
VAASVASPVLADSVGPGGTAAIVVFVLIIACVGIFIAFLGSIRRLRENTSNGTFKTQSKSPAADAGAAAEALKAERPEDSVTRDPGGPSGAGA